MMRGTRRAILFFAIFVCSVGFDQGSKEWARTQLPAHVAQPVIHGYWDWQLEQNPGAAFSFFTERSSSATMLVHVLLGLVAAGALIAIGILATRARPEQHVKRAALALIAGGALGNLIDRVHQGSVTDFVRWHVHDHLWPIFNVADAALVIGVGLLALDRVLAHRTNTRRPPSTA